MPAPLQAVTSYLLTRSDVRTASEVMVWLNGSLNDSTWSGPPTCCCVGPMPVAARLAHGLRGLELGDDAGGGASGGRASGSASSAVALAAVATAATGPVAFVAFLSDALSAARCRCRPRASLGALVVLAAELVAANLVPVGVVTGALGLPRLW